VHSIDDGPEHAAPPLRLRCAASKRFLTVHQIDLCVNRVAWHAAGLPYHHSACTLISGVRKRASGQVLLHTSRCIAIPARRARLDGRHAGSSPARGGCGRREVILCESIAGHHFDDEQNTGSRATGRNTDRPPSCLTLRRLSTHLAHTWTSTPRHHRLHPSRNAAVASHGRRKSNAGTAAEPVRLLIVTENAVLGASKPPASQRIVGR
jgi:hypothetical protein